MKKLIILAMVLGLLLSGCASRHWIKPGATPQVTEADLFQCRQDSEKYEHGWYWIIPYAGVFMGAANASRVANEQESCMRTKGYTLGKGLTDLPTEPQVTPSEKPTTSTPVTPSMSTEKSVTWTFANIRSGPGNNYFAVTTVKQGDKLTVIGEFGEWFNVRLENGQEGWINSRFVKER